MAAESFYESRNCQMLYTSLSVVFLDANEEGQFTMKKYPLFQM